MSESPLVVEIAHDYLCPWCWIGFFHAKRLAEEFPQVRQVWVGYELLPESLGPLPDYRPRPREPGAAPTRLELLSELEGIPIPPNRTIGIVRTHDALQGCEYFNKYAPAKFDIYNQAVYRAFWERSVDISDRETLATFAAQAGADRSHFLDALAAREFSADVIEFDDPAYARGITHVPTFRFRGEQCAEAPYATIREMMQRYLAWYGPK